MDLKALAQLAREQSRTEFIAARPNLYLTVAENADQLGPSFSTVHLSSSRPATAAPGPSFELLEIVKRPGNPYPDRISLGRAKNCDLVVRHSSVSKLHAYFRSGESGLELIDLGSQNGTSINGRCLLPNAPEWLEVDDVLLIGAVTGKILDADALHRWLLAH
jgi:hypothetical protein